MELSVSRFFLGADDADVFQERFDRLSATEEFSIETLTSRESPIELNISDEFQIEAMAAIGKPGDASLLPQKLRSNESPSERRKLSASICEGPWLVNS